MPDGYILNKEQAEWLRDFKKKSGGVSRDAQQGRAGGGQGPPGLSNPNVLMPGGNTVLIKITGNASGGGQYNGRILSGTSTADGSGNLAMPEGLTVPAADNAIVLNEDEDGQATHWLKTDTFAVGETRGTYSDKTIVVIPRGVPRIASPQTVGSSSEGSTTADTATWTRTATTSGTNYGDIPLTLWVVGRVVYDHAGDEKLYAMVRSLTFTADGKLNAVSGETQVEIDAPEDC